MMNNFIDFPKKNGERVMFDYISSCCYNKSKFTADHCKLCCKLERSSCQQSIINQLVYYANANDDVMKQKINIENYKTYKSAANVMICQIIYHIIAQFAFWTE